MLHIPGYVVNYRLQAVIAVCHFEVQCASEKMMGTIRGEELKLGWYLTCQQEYIGIVPVGSFKNSFFYTASLNVVLVSQQADILHILMQEPGIAVNGLVSKLHIGIKGRVV